MSRTFTIAARELPAYLLSPGGYVITALFLVITGFLFSFGGFDQGQTASLRRVANFASYSMDDVFDIYASASGLLVMLDGLDEVSTTEYPRMSTAINGLSQKLGQTGDRNIIILTRRIQFHQQVRTEYQVEFPNVVSLKPFSPSDIYEFLSRWPFAEERDQKVARIFSTLTDRPTLRDSAR